MPMIGNKYYSDLRPLRESVESYCEILNDAFGVSRLYDYQPGNGTRYIVQLTQFVENRLLGHHTLLNIVNFRVSMEIPSKLDPETSIGYMMEKLSHKKFGAAGIISEGDCYALIPLINDFLSQFVQE